MINNFSFILIKVTFYSILPFVFLFSNNSYSQVTYENINNSNIYMFLDELANNNIIHINSTIKPYKKENIFQLLEFASKNNKLNERQKKECNFYLEKYLFYSNKSKEKKSFFNDNFLNYQFINKDFKFSINPIWGINSFINNEHKASHVYGGLSFNASYSTKWSFYANLSDNTMTEPFALPNYLTNYNGGNYKLWINNDYSEMRGGVIYNFNWGNIGLIKDHIEWGDNYSTSNIFSGRTPSFPLFKINLSPVKWLDFNYIHGWLVSEVIDSTKSYINTEGNFRGVNRGKYIAANMFTIMPNNKISFSFGNSIVYSDLGGGYIGYFIPFLFYKSLDHTVNHNIENQNSQMFFNLSSRSFKHLHLYTSFFIDEFQKDRIFIDSLSNFVSYKFGGKLSNYPISNISNIIEFTRTTPMTFKHYNASTTFESNQYNLGHHLIDNSLEFYYSFIYQPFYNLKLISEYIYSMHADDLEYSYNNNYNPVSIPILQNKTWDNQTFNITISYQLMFNVNLSVGYQFSNVNGYDHELYNADYFLNKFTPEYLYGKNSFFNFKILFDY